MCNPVHKPTDPTDKQKDTGEKSNLLGKGNKYHQKSQKKDCTVGS